MVWSAHCKCVYFEIVKFVIGATVPDSFTLTDITGILCTINLDFPKSKSQINNLQFSG